mgnify:CR=1 FL=1
MKHVGAAEGVPREVAEAIRMKSVCIAGTRLDHDHHCVGVVIIESIKSWTDEKLQDRIEAEDDDFATLRDTAAEIIYIVGNSLSDVQ